MTQNRKNADGINGGKRAESDVLLDRTVSERVQNACIPSLRAAHNPEVAGSSPAAATRKRGQKRFLVKKTERFQDLRGPWIVKIQGPQNLDFSPPPIHSGRT